MDTSKEYIGMCEKAEKIQELRPHLFGDFRFDIVTRKINVIHANSDMDDQETFIWLPRQDQLQKMVRYIQKEISDLRDNPIWLAIALAEWIEDCAKEPDNYHQNFKSMEQLWLAFVMKEKYNKTWDGKEWVKG